AGAEQGVWAMPARCAPAGGWLCVFPGSSRSRWFGCILRPTFHPLPEAVVFERISRSWGLIRASAGVLAKDKELLVFPLLSAVCTLVVAAAFLLPAFGLGALDGLGERG